MYFKYFNLLGVQAGFTFILLNALFTRPVSTSIPNAKPFYFHFVMLKVGNISLALLPYRMATYLCDVSLPRHDVKRITLWLFL